MSALLPRDDGGPSPLDEAPWNRAFRLLGTDDWKMVRHVVKLPPTDVLLQVARAVEDRMQPCGKPSGKELTALLLGLYPHARPHDVDIYVRGIVALLAAYPRDVAATAIDVVSRTCRFLPTRAELHTACEEAMRPRRQALAVLRRACHERQDRACGGQQDEPPPPSPERRAEIIETLRRWRSNREE